MERSAELAVDQPLQPCPDVELANDVTEAVRSVEHEEIPDGGYGWVCVACVFGISAHTWGINSAYGVFLAFYLSQSTFPSATPMEYAFVGGLSISQCLFISPIATLTSRLTNTPTTLTIGIILQTGGLIGASFATEISHLFVSWTCVGWGMGFLIVGSAGIIPQWFSRQRSLANGIAAAGVGFGGLVYNLATNTMIERIGTSNALRVLAGCSFVVNAICTALIRDRNKVVLPSQHPFDVRLFKRPEFLLCLSWGFLSDIGYVILWFSMPAYAQSIGLSSQQGSIIAALLNLGTCIGRPAVGYFSDRFGRLNVATLMGALCGLMCLLIWVVARGFETLCVFAVLAGLVCGSYWGTVVPITAEIMALKDVPSALSITFLILVFPSTFAEPVALKLRREVGNIYLDAQIFTGSCFVMGALCCGLLRSWRIVNLEKEAAAKREREGTEGEEIRSNVTAAEEMLNIFKALLVWKRV